MGVKLYVNLETVLLNNIFVMSIFTTKRQCRLSVLQHLMRLQFDTQLSQRRLDPTNEVCVCVCVSIKASHIMFAFQQAPLYCTRQDLPIKINCEMQFVYIQCIVYCSFFHAHKYLQYYWKHILLSADFILHLCTILQGIIQALGLDLYFFLL